MMSQKDNNEDYFISVSNYLIGSSFNCDILVSIQPSATYICSMMVRNTLSKFFLRIGSDEVGEASSDLNRLCCELNSGSPILGISPILVYLKKMLSGDMLILCIPFFLRQLTVLIILSISIYFQNLLNLNDGLRLDSL